MKSNYALYIKEREDIDILEDKRGFVTYKLKEDCVHLYDMFIRIEHRRKKVATEFMEKLIKIAKENRVNKIITHVCTETNNWKISRDALVGYGFTLDGVHNSLIFLSLEV